MDYERATNEPVVDSYRGTLVLDRLGQHNMNGEQQIMYYI